MGLRKYSQKPIVLGVKTMGFLYRLCLKQILGTCICCLALRGGGRIENGPICTLVCFGLLGVLSFRREFRFRC